MVNNSIGKVVPVRVTFGGAIHAFDFRKLLNETGDVAVYRVFDRELPAALKKKATDVIAEIGEWAVANEKFAEINELRDTLKIFEAREKMTDELAKKTKAMIKVSEQPKAGAK